MDCALCDAFARDRDRIIYEDGRVFVMVNIEPLKDGHVMILPVRHVEQLRDLTPEEAQAFLRAVDACMGGVAEAYRETPMCLVNGWSYRTQPHLHAHVLPSKKDLRGLYAAAEGLEVRKRADAAALRRIVEKLKPFFAAEAGSIKDFSV